MHFDDPVTGKREQRSTKVPGESNAKGEPKAGCMREAERIAAKWEAEMREGRCQRDNGLKWEQFRERCEDE